MAQALEQLNKLPAAEAQIEFLQCCNSRAWAIRMTELRPFATLDELKQTADDVWWSSSPPDWLEAFSGHPRIGENKAGKVKAASWSRQEQAGVSDAGSDRMQLLAELNRQYEAKFGYIFIVCASGKNSDEILSILRSRLSNDLDQELRIAAGEQAKITMLRLDKLLNQ